MIRLDNFLEEDVYNNLYENIMSPDFPWYVTDGSVSTGEDVAWDHRDIFFNHLFIRSPAYVSPLYPIVAPIVEKLNPKAILNVRANLDIARSAHFEYGMHNDTNDMMTAVYYVNTNNGGTKFADGELIPSVANSIVIFDSNKMHTPVTATDVRRRVLINFNYIPYKDENDK
jgi:hypothetical protein